MGHTAQGLDGVSGVTKVLPLSDARRDSLR